MQGLVTPDRRQEKRPARRIAALRQHDHLALLGDQTLCRPEPGVFPLEDRSRIGGSFE